MNTNSKILMSFIFAIVSITIMSSGCLSGSIEDDSESKIDIQYIGDMFLLGYSEDADDLDYINQEYLIEDLLSREIPQNMSKEEYFISLANNYGVEWNPPALPEDSIDIINDEDVLASVVGANCGSYVSNYYPATYQTENIEKYSGASGYSAGPNCRMSAPGGSYQFGYFGWGYYNTDCGSDLYKDDMLSFFMGYNNHNLSTYKANLKYWHSSSTARSLLGTLSSRVYEFAWTGQNPDHQYNIYACIPWQLTYYESGIVMKQLL